MGGFAVMQRQRNPVRGEGIGQHHAHATGMRNGTGVRFRRPNPARLCAI